MRRKKEPRLAQKQIKRLKPEMRPVDKLLLLYAPPHSKCVAALVTTVAVFSWVWSACIMPTGCMKKPDAVFWC